MESKTVTILLVEDDEPMLEGMSDLVEAANLAGDGVTYDIKVLSAANGLEALQKLGAETPDLIVSDIMMPHMTGYEFLEEVRKNPDWFQIPFIFLTARGETQDYNMGKLGGANLYITKPFNSAVFLQHVTTQLNNGLKRSKWQKEQVDTLKRQILQILNHEFRTPLTYVTAYYDMLSTGVSELANGKEPLEYLRGIQAGCKRLSRLIDNFMLIIAIKSGEIRSSYEQEVEPIPDVAALVEAAIQNYQAQAQQLGVTIHANYGSNLPALLGVPRYLQKSVELLLDNAIKFTKRNDTAPQEVQVSVQATEQRIELSIADSGIGFPDHMKNKLFEVFVQYNRAFTEQQGAGVGLSIVKGLVDLHGGKIEVETTEGVGSTFTILLPTTLATTIDEPPTRSKRQQKAIILAVEDDENLLEGLADLLLTMDSNYEIEVLTAANGLEGLEIVKQITPDLIISDIMMPKMSGFAFLSEVRQNADWLQIPVIFLTAKGEQADKNKAFIEGVDEYITKPYDSDILLQYVKAQLNRRFQIRDILDKSFELFKEDIISLVNPNLLQPLTFVSDYAVQLSNELKRAETDRDLAVSLKGIQVGSNWLRRLIEDFMSLAELKTGEAQLSFHWRAQTVQNVCLFITEFAGTHGHLLQESGIQLIYEHRGETVQPIVTDVVKITESIRRLIELGTAYIPENQGVTLVRIVSEQVDNALAISVTIDVQLPEKISRIVHDILEAPGDDLLFRSLEFGPNLSIVKGYVQLHNGRITYHDDHQCAFTITLPTVSAAMPSAA